MRDIGSSQLAKMYSLKAGRGALHYLSRIDVAWDREIEKMLIP